MRFAHASGARPLPGYKINRGIGIGGFGEVYFAETDAGKHVALKCIQRNLEIEIRGVTHCLNLRHPNLISIHDIKYDDDGQGWVVMEYITGDSLRQVLDQHPDGLAEREAVQWFRGLAAGVAYLHDQGIVHRDLKPGNIFLDDGELVKIGDYGLSKYISCNRRSGHTESVGTCHYMAPEIGRGVYGKEIDIYALGVILYEMLSGRLPFDGESSHEIIMKHLTAEPDLSVVPPAYRPVIQRALFKDPQQRFASANDLLAAVERAWDEPAENVVWGTIVEPSPAAAPPAAAPTSPPFAKTAPAPPGRVAAPSSAQPEPIAAAVTDVCQRAINWWRQTNLTPTVRVLLIVGLVLSAVFNSGVLVPLAVTLVIGYAVYYCIRCLVLALNGPTGAPSEPSRPPPAATVPQAAAAAVVAPPLVAAVSAPPVPPRHADNVRDRRRRREVNWKAEARRRLGQRSAGDRVAELSGSWFMAALVVLVVNLVALLITAADSRQSLGNVFVWGLYAWMSLVGTAGAWMILSLSQAWESDEGDSMRRRFVLLVAGLALGLFAFGAAEFLDVRLYDGRPVIGAELTRLSGVGREHGAVELPAFVIFFGGMLFLSRWWLQTDPLRDSRFSIGATVLCVFAVWLLQQFQPFPEPWGVLSALAMSLAVQMAAPWMTMSERNAVRKSLA